MRMDVTDSNGARTGGVCASLGAHSSSSASNTSSLLKPPVHTAPEPGQEVETHNLLIISQNTFEGNTFIKFYGLLFLVLH